MPRKLTPMMVQWAVIFHVSAEPIDEIGKCQFHSEAGKNVYHWMQAEGLIDSRDQPTSRLAAFVNFLCETPLPEKKWVRPGE